jgi:hypothetical protein
MLSLPEPGDCSLRLVRSASGKMTSDGALKMRPAPCVTDRDWVTSAFMILNANQSFQLLNPSNQNATGQIAPTTKCRNSKKSAIYHV